MAGGFLPRLMPATIGCGNEFIIKERVMNNVEILKDAAIALNTRPNFKLPGGKMSYQLLSQVDKTVNDANFSVFVNRDEWEVIMLDSVKTALNSQANFRLPDGRTSYQLLSQLDSIINAAKSNAASQHLFVRSQAE